MHNGDDQDAVGADLVEDAIRKATHDAAPRPGGEQRPSSRECPNTFEGRLDLLGEFVAESRTLTVVVIDGLDEFALRAG
jgi:hypothetical protein